MNTQYNKWFDYTDENFGNFHVINTGLYSEKAKLLFDKLYDAMSNTFGHSKLERYTALSSFLFNDITNELQILYRESYYGGTTIFNKRRHRKETIFEWFAGQIKKYVINDIKADWDRRNRHQIIYDDSNKIDVTVSDAYLIYDYILKRKYFNKHYSSKYIQEIIGHPYDDIRSACEKELRNKITDTVKKYKVLKRQYNLDTTNISYCSSPLIRDDYNKTIKPKIDHFRHELETEFINKYKKIISYINNSEATEIEEIKKEYSFINDMNNS